MRLISAVVFLVSLTAHAQSTCSVAFGGDGGCDRVRFEFRPAAGTYGGAGSLDVEVGPNDRPLFVHPLTHGADYAWRAPPLTSQEAAAAAAAAQVATPVQPGLHRPAACTTNPEWPCRTTA